MLDRLAEHDRDVILAIKVEGMTTSEVARRDGVPNNVVSLALHRAIRRLQALYEGSNS
jgi:DNA-directed RNA polymerase specialized sigma24 family protein